MSVNVVENHLHVKGILQRICVFTLKINHMAVECMENHFLRKAVVKRICLFMLEINHIVVGNYLHGNAI